MSAPDPGRGSDSTGLEWAGRFASNAGVLFVSYGFNTVLSAVVAVFLIQHLGREEYGHLTAIYSYISFFVIFTSIGVDTIVQRDVARNPERAGEIVGRAMGLRVVLSLGSLVLGILLLPAIDPSPRVAILTVVAMLSFPFSFDGLFLVLYSVRLRMARPKLVMGVWSIILSAIKLGLIFLGAPLEAFVILEPISAAVVFFVARRMGRSSGLGVRMELDRSGWMGLLRESWPVAAASTFIQVYLRLDHLMLYRLTDAAEVGLYGATTRLMEFANVYPTIFMVSAFPLLARFGEESQDRLRRATRLSFRAMLWVSLPAAILLHRYGAGILVLLFGETFGEGSPIVALLAWTIPMSFMNAVLYNRLFTAGQQGTAAAVAFVAAMVNFGLNIPLIVRFQGEGAAVATLVSYGIVVPLALVASASRQVARDACVVAVRPILAAAAAYALLQATDPGMILGGALVVAGYGAGLVLLGEIGKDEIRVIRRSMGRAP